MAPGTDREGREVVLKVAWHHTEALHEAEALAALGGQGAVEVYTFEHLTPSRSGRTGYGRRHRHRHHGDAA